MTARLLSFHWLVLFQLLPHLSFCCGSTDVCENIDSRLCVRTCGSRNNVPNVRRANDSSSETFDNSSMYERSCGPCSCLIVVE